MQPKPECPKSSFAVTGLYFYDNEVSGIAGGWFRTFKLPVAVTNCSNNYGPCQFPEKSMETIGYRTGFSFEQALSDTIDWYLEHMGWVRSVQTVAYKEWIKSQYEAGK